MSCRRESEDGECLEHYSGINRAVFDGQHTDGEEPVCDWWAWMFSHDGDCAGCERG